MSKKKAGGTRPSSMRDQGDAPPQPVDQTTWRSLQTQDTMQQSISSLLGLVWQRVEHQIDELVVDRNVKKHAVAEAANMMKFVIETNFVNVDPGESAEDLASDSWLPGASCPPADIDTWAPGNMTIISPSELEDIEQTDRRRLMALRQSARTTAKARFVAQQNTARPKSGSNSTRVRPVPPATTRAPDAKAISLHRRLETAGTAETTANHTPAPHRPDHAPQAHPHTRPSSKPTSASSQTRQHSATSATSRNGSPPRDAKSRRIKSASTSRPSSQTLATAHHPAPPVALDKPRTASAGRRRPKSGRSIGTPENLPTKPAFAGNKLDKLPAISQSS
ncbi:uncharacterized protein MONBRDRAFT_10816 [Monosiga brevicollis MX1]|uniref:Uncharacterized protein n=1 Tax=Monosiga brevicollis TaxID=81824 RepID=A9V7B6_MONBE|nr:uncharacterized protein MONBRDRAFT_10816 [Monosiga brevicollis MX1]EDQ86488.1 predicted protein [Monosiga brevicollis MX1]|eukprot:XP_001748601.1 hypothetical protein [Monosiga brevicollis MX1]